MTAEQLAKTANLRRADAATMIHRAGGGHTGGAMSSLDILTCLFYQVMRQNPAEPCDRGRDRFLLSKGHSVEGYLAILADLGYFDKRELRDYSRPGSRLIGHPNNHVPGMECCTGALGHGLPIGVGMALGAKRTGQDFKVYVVMGDGEQAEGSVWEAAMAAAHHRLDNLYAVIDRNGLQISGSTEAVMALDSLGDKWRAFGWEVTEGDGHDMAALTAFFSGPHESGKPRLLIAATVKGKGLPFAENKPEWHHKVPTKEQLLEAYKALGVQGVEWE